MVDRITSGSPSVEDSTDPFFADTERAATVPSMTAEQQFIHGLALWVLMLADTNEIDAPPEIITAIKEADSFVEGQRIATEEFGTEFAQRAVNQVRAEVQQSAAMNAPFSYANRLVQYQQRREDELAEARVIDDLLRLEGETPHIKYERESDTWWYQLNEGGEVWVEVDPMKLSQNWNTPSAAIIPTTDNGGMNTRIETIDWGWEPPEPEEDLEPFGPRGRIPGTFRSNLRLGTSEYLDSIGIDDPYEQRLQTQAGLFQGTEEARFGTPKSRYFDQYNLFAGLPAEEVATWQNMLVDAGYLKLSDIAAQHGLWMGATPDAMADALFDADTNWDGDVAGWLQRVAQVRANMTDEEKAREAGLRPFTAPAYRAPDYATLANTARTAIQRELGRPIRDYEMSLLSRELGEWDRASFNAEVAAQRGEWEAGNKAILEEENTAAGTVQAVDPMSRLLETIQTRYAGEIDSNRRRQETNDLAQRVSGMISGISGSI